MKRLFSVLAAACALISSLTGCYDDSAIQQDIADLKTRVTNLEERIKNSNDCIFALQSAVAALESNVFVTSVKEIEGGYEIRFSNNTTAVIHNGKDGNTPVIGVKQYEGVYYWTLNGTWLPDDKGNKIPVTGKDGSDGKDAVAPQLKIEDGYWYISTDGGETWTMLAKATGEDGDAFFSNVEWDYSYLYLTLASDGTVLTLPMKNIKELFNRIQSIVYVPDYDDLKITVNSAVVSCGNQAVLLDQPTEITYQILPAQFAEDVAESIYYTNANDGFYGPETRDILKNYGYSDCYGAWFDVRPVKTRSGSGEEPDCGLKILDIVSADNETGEITFKVLPVNIASESFAAAGLKPSKEVYSDNLVHYVYDLDALQAYENRSAFAVQLRLYCLQDSEMTVEEDEETVTWTDFEDEIASTYTTLYPNILEPVALQPSAYVPVTGDDGSVSLEEAPVEEHQSLPYTVFRKDADEDEPGFRTMFDGLTLVFNIDGKLVTLDEAYELYDYVLPGYKKDVTLYHDQHVLDAILETVNENRCVEIEMNPEVSEEARLAAVGGSVRGLHVFDTPFGKFEYNSYVDIIRPMVTVKASAAIDWEYSLDAAVDHDRYYNAEGIYSRREQPMEMEGETGLDPSVFDGQKPASLVVRNAKGKDVTSSVDFVPNPGTGKMYISGFEWDDKYTFEAIYDFGAEKVKVKGEVVTRDRNRETIVLDLPAYKFVLNGPDFNPDAVLYSASVDLKDEFFDAFVAGKIINQGAEPDFATPDAFVSGEGVLTVCPVEHSMFLAASDDYVTITAAPYELRYLLENPEEVQSITVSTYTGQEVQIILPVSVDFPSYDFLHHSNYTFRASYDLGLGTSINTYDFAANDGSVTWWSQVAPAYYTTGADPTYYQDRSTSRYGLYDYDVCNIDLATLAFMVVDENDQPLDPDKLEELGITVRFGYTQPELGDQPLPLFDMSEDKMTYSDLWEDETTFYYRTNEFSFIPMRGTLSITSGGTEFFIPTRFDGPRYSKTYGEDLDYSGYALVGYDPFYVMTAPNITCNLNGESDVNYIIDDKYGFVYIPLAGRVSLWDKRPGDVFFQVLDNGKWVTGNVSPADAASGKPVPEGNGFVEGVKANNAYCFFYNHSATIGTDFLPGSMKSRIAVCYSVEGSRFSSEQGFDMWPYLRLDLSEIEFHGVLSIPVYLELQSPWQPALTADYWLTIEN